jgi:outer membrane protein assembly factor BamD
MHSPTALRRGLALLSVCVLVLGGILASGCASNRGNSRQQRLARFSPEALYDQGRKALRAHDYAEAVNVYEALNARYPFTTQSRQGRLDIIYAYYRLGEKESAKDAADTFIRENPTHPRIDYAYYIRGLIDFERTPYKFETWLGLDPSARPPESARDAITSLRTVVTRYPKSLYAADARRRMVYLRNRLADYQLRVAGYYIDRGAWVAAALRARETIEQYDGAPAMKDALRVMIYCYRKLDYKDLAENTLRVFQQNFPDESPELPRNNGSWWKFWG